MADDDPKKASSIAGLAAAGALLFGLGSAGCAAPAQKGGAEPYKDTNAASARFDPEAHAGEVGFDSVDSIFADAVGLPPLPLGPTHHTYHEGPFSLRLRRSFLYEGMAYNIDGDGDYEPSYTLTHIVVKELDRFSPAGADRLNDANSDEYRRLTGMIMDSKEMQNFLKAEFNPYGVDLKPDDISFTVYEGQISLNGLKGMEHGKALLEFIAQLFNMAYEIAAESNKDTHLSRGENHDVDGFTPYVASTFTNENGTFADVRFVLYHTMGEAMRREAMRIRKEGL